jgi:hypothetical protein
VNLLVWSLQAAIGELARARHVPKFRVDYKVNARGEIVIALILPPTDSALPPERTPSGRAKHLR